MDSIANVSVMVNDTIEYLEKSDVVAFYSDMMDKQATQFTIIVSLISAVFVIATTATWWWNYRGAKQQIKEEVSAAKQVLNKLYKNHQRAIENTLKKYENEFNGYKGSLQKSVNLQIDSKINDAINKETEKLNLHMEEVDQHSMQEIEALKKKTILDITQQKAEVARIFALYCSNVKAPLTSVTWWIEAMKNYALMKNDEWVGRSCESIVKLLKDVDVTKLNKESYENLEEDKEIINQYLPMTRQSDKQFILNKLNEIQKALKDKQE